MLKLKKKSKSSYSQSVVDTAIFLKLTNNDYKGKLIEVIL